MTEDEAKYAAEDLQRRREIVEQLLTRTRLEIEPLLAKLQATADPDPRDISRLQLLTFQGRVLVNVMGTIADDATKLANRYKNTKEAARRAAPTINMNEIEIPDYMPEQL